MSGERRSPRLCLVRHAEVTVRPDQSSSHWHLSPPGRAAAEALAGESLWTGLAALHTSPEPKAEATAQRIAARHGLPLRIVRGLREVENRGWVGEGYRELVRRYLAGETLDAWEPRAAALGRVRACIDRIVAAHTGRDVALVSHGLVLALYLAELLGLDATGAYDLWARMRFPDVAVVDVEKRRVERGLGQPG